MRGGVHSETITLDMDGFSIVVHNSTNPTHMKVTREAVQWLMIALYKDAVASADGVLPAVASEDCGTVVDSDDDDAEGAAMVEEIAAVKADKDRDTVG